MKESRFDSTAPNHGEKWIKFLKWETGNTVKECLISLAQDCQLGGTGGNLSTQLSNLGGFMMEEM